jgi:hypothetical protein
VFVFVPFSREKASLLCQLVVACVAHTTAVRAVSASVFSPDARRAVGVPFSGAQALLACLRAESSHEIGCCGDVEVSVRHVCRLPFHADN